MDIQCPNCKHVFTQSASLKRIYAICKRSIALHHKYFLKTENGKTFLVHRHYDNPYEYVPKVKS